MSAILIESQVIHYEVLGRGRPLIFLHGWVGSWRYWIPVMQAACSSYRAYAIDLWGFGDSAKFSAQYSLDKQVSLLEKFLEQMGIGKIALVGHGLGSVVAALYAQRHPEVVDRLMLVSYPLDEAKVHPRIKAANPNDLAEWLLDKSPLTEPVRVETPKTDPLAILTSINGLNEPQVRDAVLRLSRPCLLIHGENDPAVIAPDLDVLMRLPTQAHEIVFEASGHFPMLDESSKFNRLLIDFLALGPGESPRELQLKEEWKRRVR